MKKSSAKFMLSLLLSAAIFCMPVGAYFANSNYVTKVHAQNTDRPEDIPFEKNR